MKSAQRREKMIRDDAGAKPEPELVFENARQPYADDSSFSSFFSEALSLLSDQVASLSLLASASSFSNCALAASSSSISSL